MLVFDFFWLFVLRCAIVLQLFIITNQNEFAYDIVYIPQRLILTKVDNLDLCGNGDVSGVFRSRHAQQKVQQVKEKFVYMIANFYQLTITSENLHKTSKKMYWHF